MILRTVRTARVEHDCDWCRSEIEPGTRYVEAKLPPGDGEVGNTTWLRAKRHLRRECYPFGSDPIPDHLLPEIAEETAKQVEGLRSAMAKALEVSR